MTNKNKLLFGALVAVSAASLGTALSSSFGTLPETPDLKPASPDTILANSPQDRR